MTLDDGFTRFSKVALKWKVIVTAPLTDTITVLSVAGHHFRPSCLQEIYISMPLFYSLKAKKKKATYAAMYI